MQTDPSKLWLCVNQKCGAVLQDTELERLQGHGGEVLSCPRCHDRVELTSDIEKWKQARPTANYPLYVWVILSLIYPFSIWGTLMLLLGAAAVGLIHVGLKVTPVFGVFGILFSLLAQGYLVSYIFEIVSASTGNDNQAPGPSAIRGWWSDLLKPLIFFVAITVFCFWPAMLYSALEFEWLKIGGLKIPGPFRHAEFILSASLMGQIYFGMALLAAVLHENLRGLSPGVVLKSIFRILIPYIGVVIFVTALETGASLLQMKLDDVLPVYVAAFTAGFLSIYVLFVFARCMGVLYRTYESRLGWF